jgi:NADH-quinone oxidoreductase subunit G
VVKLTIDTIPVEIPEGTTILNAAKSVGVVLPTLCYMKDVNDIGACRVCVAEIEGRNKLVTTCNTPVSEGMVVMTNSPRAREARRVNIQFILSQHDCNCPTCIRSTNCGLQKIANDLGIISQPYTKEVPDKKWDMTFPLIKDDSKCIKCMRCIQVCDKIQSVGVWGLDNTGSRTTVGVTCDREIAESDCVLCGQCITHCPTGALTERDDTMKAFRALANPDIITVVQIAPAVRAAWGESLGISREFATVKRLVAALRKIGFDYIFDTNFTADLTIIEEGNEFVKRKFATAGHNKYPLFTSCCPGWVRFMKSQYPDMMEHFSTTKSPQQMFGAVAKTYLAEILKVDPSKIFCVSVMPCTAKKAECALPTMDSTGTGPDVDLVLTTREIDRMIVAEHIQPLNLTEEEFDQPMGMSTGAGVIFGASGGVMEAALRSVYFLATGENPDVDSFANVRGMNGWREATFYIEGKPVNIAVASGLANARNLVEAIRKGDVQVDFVEVMACPGGCSGGGGQPIALNKELAQVRGQSLYGLDRNSALRFSHENPSIGALYERFEGNEMAQRVHELLHTDHDDWEMPLSPKLQGKDC